MAIACRKLPPTDRAGFDAAHRIYERAIVPSEQKSRERLLAALSSDAYQFLVAEEVDEDRSAKRTIVGMALIFVAREFKLLEYLAVDAKARCGGVGSALLAAAGRALVPQREFRPPPLLLEVDAEAAATQHFYARRGCSRIANLSYLLPLAGAAAPPMHLWIAYGPALLPRATLRRWIETIYRDVYDVPPTDPRIDRMLENVSDPAGIETSG